MLELPKGPELLSEMTNLEKSAPYLVEVRLESSPVRIPKYRHEKNPEASQALSVDLLIKAAEQDPDLGDTVVVKTAETVKTFSDISFIKGSIQLLSGMADVPVLLLSKATVFTFSLAIGGIAGLSIPVMKLWSTLNASETKEEKINKLSNKISILENAEKRVNIQINTSIVSLVEVDEKIKNVPKNEFVSEKDRVEVTIALIDQKKAIETKLQEALIRGKKINRVRLILEKANPLEDKKENGKTHKERIIYFRKAVMAGAGPISVLGESLLTHVFGKEEEEEERLKKFNSKLDNFLNWAGTGFFGGLGTVASGSAITSTADAGVAGAAVAVTLVLGGAVLAALTGGNFGEISFGSQGGKDEKGLSEEEILNEVADLLPKYKKLS